MENGGGREPDEWDWDDPINEEELDAAFSLAESISSRKRQNPCLSHVDDDDRDRHRSRGRRLPNWVVATSASRNRATQSQNSLSADHRHHLHPILDGQKDSTGSPRDVHCDLLPSPCRFSSQVKYPVMRFGGRIVYCRTFREVEKATMELLETIKANEPNIDQIPLGLDIEWRPTFRRGEAQGKASVLQLCMGTDNCYVMHIIHSGIPPILQSLLEDSTSVKVGVCIANDAVKVMKDYNVCIKALEDLSGLANIKLGGVPKKWSLGSLTETLTCKQLEKPNKIRMGNWEANALSKGQLQYAATDAFASWYLYQVLKSLPDAANDQVVEEKANGVHDHKDP
ncbi:3'-5' exonuclease-like isoform X2 [Magnolia sinica]|uniref:3'-5' exonuclease-like isoform X2 n=1 Tax=Magnolia sinica TaxID=86752 RepID=UPI002658B0E0|nr:3'-5' exonuclease-like isoform X2 [Magnolia sinica]